MDYDIYSMLVPGETDQGIKITNTPARGGLKESNKKPNNIRCPF
jgi:hypothetical protein